MRFWPVLSFVTLIAACGSPEQPASETPTAIGLELRGEAQGTTYTIKYLGDTLNHQASIDSLLDAFDRDLSTWRDGSLINRINAYQNRDSVFTFVDSTKFFSAVYAVSREIHRITDGAFNPTVLPLLRGWGFSLEKREDMTPARVDSLLELVDFTTSAIGVNEVNDPENPYVYSHTELIKLKPHVELDFNAIAQGYSIDLIGDLLRSRGIEDYMIELGGEVLCAGSNPNGNPWNIQIDRPVEGNEHIQQAIVRLDNKALATSGNYRKFYEVDGQKYSHIIDPKTGYPAQSPLLSATVVASDCGTADAYATALMVMGEEAIPFLQAHPQLGIEAYLIFDRAGTLQPVMTAGMEAMVAKTLE